jgi:hypothetical protein
MNHRVNIDLVDAFNTNLKEEGSILRLIPEINAVRIGLVEEKYLNMEHQIINPTKEFYNELNNFFLNVGLKIQYNNTGSCFWAYELL